MVHRTVITEQRWSKSSPDGSPCGRYGHRCVVYENFMYLNGGYNGKERMRDTYAFDLEKRTWREIQNKGEVPSERDCHSAVLYKNFMVIFGGGDGFNWLNDMYMFDIKKEAWKKVEAKGQVPTGRAGHSANVYKDKMYIFAGWNGRRTLNDMYCFDFLTCTWARVEPNGTIPQSRDSHTANLVDDKIIIIGGGDGKQRLNDIHEYDIPSNTWRRLSYIGEVNAGRAGHVSVCFDGKIYIFAGGDGSNWLTDVFECDTTCMKWTLIECAGTLNEPNIAPGCYGLSAVLYKTRMIIFGGGDGKFWHNKIYEFKLGDEKRQRETKSKMFKLGMSNKLTDISVLCEEEIPVIEFPKQKKSLREPSIATSTSTIPRHDNNKAYMFKDSELSYKEFLEFEMAFEQNITRTMVDSKRLSPDRTQTGKRC
ncbi:hypothetical protein ABK040_000074 [Willaertia magna]